MACGRMLLAACMALLAAFALPRIAKIPVLHRGAQGLRASNADDGQAALGLVTISGHARTLCARLPAPAPTGVKL